MSDPTAMQAMMKMAFEMETKGTKVGIMIVALIYMVFGAVAGGLYLRHTVNVNDI